MLRLSETDKKRIEAAVAAAEARTAAEFAVTVARASDRYAAYPLAWATGLALAAGGVLMLARPMTSGSILLSVVSALFIVLAIALNFPGLRHRLAPGRIKRAQVERLALAQFAQHVQGRTHGKVGVLLFVSLAEHHAQILVERGIADAVPQQQWQATIDKLTTAIAAGRLGEGVEMALKDAASLLAPHFPLAAGDRNELPDQVREV